MTVSPKKIAIVAGEASGDILGAGLLCALKARFPDCEFVGVGGDRMIAEGFQSWFAMDRLAVMGLIEPLKRLPELLSMRRQLKKRLIASPPDVFIGIDSPDFNLSLEESLRKAGIKVAHYVSPSVWAWRQGRIKKIARAVDLMLTLFPFEEQFYQQHQVNVSCVGHTLADSIPMVPDQADAKAKLSIISQTSDFFTRENKLVALLPGSRASEVRFHSQLFFQAAERLQKKYAECRFVVAAANEKRLEEIQAVQAAFSSLPVQIVLGHSHDVMAAADAVLLASGTTALEAMLLKRPMVVAYRMSGFAFNIFKRLVKVKYVSLPNLLAGKALVPELLQDEATPEKLSNALAALLGEDNATLMASFTELHQHLKRNANEKAADAIVALIAKTWREKSA